jgi:DNA-binding MarR family transcriptional regulator
MTASIPSIESFHAEDMQDRIENQQALILKTLRETGPMTNNEISAATHLRLSSVTARINDLEKNGKVRVHHIGKGQFNRSNKFWEVC